jgi:hypothetical protein
MRGGERWEGVRKIQGVVLQSSYHMPANPGVPDLPFSTPNPSTWRTQVREPFQGHKIEGFPILLIGLQQYTMGAC